MTIENKKANSLSLSFISLSHTCYNFFLNTGLCKLFEGCKSFSTECTSKCISGRVSCPFCEGLGKCDSGKTLDIQPVYDIHECLKLCKNNKAKNCLWISYDKETKLCWQFEECDNQTEEKQYVSSETTCPSYECNTIGHCKVRYTVEYCKEILWLQQAWHFILQNNV